MAFTASEAKARKLEDFVTAVIFLPMRQACVYLAI